MDWWKLSLRVLEARTMELARVWENIAAHHNEARRITAGSMPYTNLTRPAPIQDINVLFLKLDTQALIVFERPMKNILL
jgi:hypothetical protein